MAYSSWSVVFGEQPSATKWNILGTNDSTFNDYLTGVTSPTLSAPIVKLWDGWQQGSGSWTYASATTITVPAADAAVMPVGTKIKLTQTTAKYFYVTGISGSVVTVNGGSDYTVANAAITSPFFSHEANPVGFPQWFNYTVSYTGFSANPTHVARFCITGRTCTIDVSGTANGTSNANSFTMSIPVTAATVANANWDTHGHGTDNGAGLTNPLLCRITSGGTVVTLGINLTTLSGWTASGTKGGDFNTMCYEI